MIFIVVSDTNNHITYKLLESADKIFKEHNLEYNTVHIPGCFEMVSVVSKLANKYGKDIEAIVLLGCIIKNETKHDEFLLNFLEAGISNLITKHNICVTNGIIHCEDEKYAIDRSENISNPNNYGLVAAKACVDMLKLYKLI
ncbi:hypothetical protein GUI12_00375 [Anaplasmataceae bacterium AB001_6]|nr:hypothetical protein GUI12_00375 [Anaplasmataceae bacterium AB001_6]